ncbi:hypothetical protein IVB14_01090 [Bradyrhizobium sp. 180]|uniref:hypothetical protein n=1 Tax=unclassified Bradyrhizobium TaxID=2631580 RepID=UPI001FFA7DA0|nr:MULTISPECIES: hypothetical protein [unclassified Bradyrhizobium]MCK1489076.1 hypothetical protein [Bradyrhizobium sp. 180]MCK1542358.1 hypothetical protein [Bradyrhizobium sp. 179]
MTQKQKGGKSEDVLTCRESSHVGSFTVRLSCINRVTNAGAKLLAAGFDCVEKRRVDLLDMDAAVLDRLDAGGEFN